MAIFGLNQPNLRDERPWSKRRNGQTTYFASDIAYHLNKLQRGYTDLIDIWGSDHHGYISRVKAAIDAMGYDSKN